MSTANSASISVAHGSSADDAGSAAHPAAPLADSLRIEPLTGLPARQTFGTLVPQPSPSFVVTPAVEAITQRALGYLDCGYAVHLAGPAGTGKTTLAFHVAAQLGRPVTLIHGNDEFGASDLVGKEGGYRKSSWSTTTSAQSSRPRRAFRSTGRTTASPPPANTATP